MINKLIAIIGFLPMWAVMYVYRILVVDIIIPIYGIFKNLFLLRFKQMGKHFLSLLYLPVDIILGIFPVIIFAFWICFDIFMGYLDVASAIRISIAKSRAKRLSAMEAKLALEEQSEPEVVKEKRS